MCTLKLWGYLFFFPAQIDAWPRDVRSCCDISAVDQDTTSASATTAASNWCDLMEAEEVSPALVFALGHLDSGFGLLNNISNGQIFVRCNFMERRPWCAVQKSSFTHKLSHHKRKLMLAIITGKKMTGFECCVAQHSLQLTLSALWHSRLTLSALWHSTVYNWLWVLCGTAHWLWMLCDNEEQKTATDWCFVAQCRHQAAGQYTVAQDQQSLPAVWRQAGGGGWDYHLRGCRVRHHAEWWDPGVSRWAWSGSGGWAPLRFSPMDQGKQGLGCMSICSLSWLAAELHSPSGSLLIKQRTLAADFKASSSVVLWTDKKTGWV